MKTLTIVMYHYVRDLLNSRYPRIKGLDYKLFKKQIEFFHINYHIVTMEEVVDAFDNKYTLPDNPLLLTFDDGYIDHFTYVFPILQQYKIQGSFYIPAKIVVEKCLLDVNKIHFILAVADTSNILSKIYEQLNYYRKDYNLEDNDELYNKYGASDRFDNKEIVFIKRILQTGLQEDIRSIIVDNLFKYYMRNEGNGISESLIAKEFYIGYDQIKCMKQNGMHIGLHGYEHFWLGDMDKVKMQKDIDKALEVMEGLININFWTMNYPFGSYNMDVVEYIKCKGGKLGLTTEVKVADLNLDNRFLLPRLDTNDFPPKSDTFRKYLR